jgi:hypothetical protein
MDKGGADPETTAKQLRIRVFVALVPSGITSPSFDLASTKR